MIATFVSVLALLLAAQDALALDLHAIHRERLFKLEYSGKISYILGTEHGFSDFAGHDMSEIVHAIRASNEIALEGDPDTETDEAEFALAPEYLGPKPNYLRKHLSTKSLNLLKNFSGGRSLETVLSLKPGVALWGLKSIFTVRRRDYREQYFAATEGLNQIESPAAAKFGPIDLEDSLSEAAPLIFGRSVEASELAAMTANYIQAGKPAPKMRGLDDFVLAEGRAAGLPLLPLDRFESMNHKTAVFKLVTVQDLDRFLRSLSQLMVLDRVASHAVNNIVASLLQEELSNQFFSLSPEEYARLHSMLTIPMAAYQPILPGEEAVENYLSNRHEEWVDALMDKIKTGGVFIAAGAGHVIPKFDPTVRKTLLQAFAENGVHIEPIFPCPERLIARNHLH